VRNLRFSKAKTPPKRGFLPTKSCFWGDEFLRIGEQIERRNGAKCTFFAQNRRKNKMRETRKGAKSMFLRLVFR